MGGEVHLRIQSTGLYPAYVSIVRSCLASPRLDVLPTGNILEISFTLESREATHVSPAKHITHTRGQNKSNRSLVNGFQRARSLESRRVQDRSSSCPPPAKTTTSREAMLGSGNEDLCRATGSVHGGSGVPEQWRAGAFSARSAPNPRLVSPMEGHQHGKNETSGSSRQHSQTNRVARAGNLTLRNPARLAERACQATSSD